MKPWVASVITDEGIGPDVLAKAWEDNGFDSPVVAEHSPIPPVGPRRSQRTASCHASVAGLTIHSSRLAAAALATSKLRIELWVFLFAATGPDRNSEGGFQ